jgi:hypothetical protein
MSLALQAKIKLLLGKRANLRVSFECKTVDRNSRKVGWRNKSEKSNCFTEKMSGIAQTVKIELNFPEKKNRIDLAAERQNCKIEPNKRSN